MTKTTMGPESEKAKPRSAVIKKSERPQSRSGGSSSRRLRGSALLELGVCAPPPGRNGFFCHGLRSPPAGLPPRDLSPAGFPLHGRLSPPGGLLLHGRSPRGGPAGLSCRGRSLRNAPAAGLLFQGFRFSPPDPCAGFPLHGRLSPAGGLLLHGRSPRGFPLHGRF